MKRTIHDATSTTGESSTAASTYTYTNSRVSTNTASGNTTNTDGDNGACCNFMGVNKRMHLSNDDGSSRPVAGATAVHPATSAASAGGAFNVPYNMTDGERLIASEMNSLSLMDRQTVQEDIHGVKDAVAETPDFIRDKLEELEVAIKALRKKDAYSKAAFLSPKIVQERLLRLQLLRTAEWDVEKAAKLLATHFNYKLKLFGEEAFVRPVRWEDLKPDAQRSLRAGSVVRYESSEEHNRRGMLFLNYASFHYETPESMLQSLFFTGDASRGGADDAVKGLVAVVNTVGSEASQLFMAIKASQTISKWGIKDTLPMRFTSNHFCLGETWVRPYISMLLMTVSKEIRLRTKFHFGSHMECMYELGSFGIPLQLLPFDGEGQPIFDVLERHTQNIQAVAQEKWQAYMADKPEGLIHSPREIDVVLGRGWPYQSFSGNVKLMEFLTKEKHLYDEAPSRMQKTLVTATFVVRIRQLGVRFLKRDDSGLFWEEVSDTAARQKVAMSIRNLSRKPPEQR